MSLHRQIRAWLNPAGVWLHVVSTLPQVNRARVQTCSSSPPYFLVFASQHTC